MPRFLAEVFLFIGKALVMFLPRRAWRHALRDYVRKYFMLAYFERFTPVLKTLPEEKIAEGGGERTIWQFWAQGENTAPDIVKVCFESVRRRKGAWNHRILTMDNIRDYVDFPGHIWDRWREGDPDAWRRCRPMNRAHFSDLVRLEVLRRHGGVWLDATCLMTKGIPEWAEDLDFFVYLVGNAGLKYSFVQNCFIRAKKGSYLLGAWEALCLEYWRREKTNIDYFFQQVLFEKLVKADPRARALFEAMPHIGQDATHCLDPHFYDRFDRDKFESYTSGAFFQKMTHKPLRAVAPDSIYGMVRAGRVPGFPLPR